MTEKKMVPVTRPASAFWKKFEDRRKRRKGTSATKVRSPREGTNKERVKRRMEAAKSATFGEFIAAIIAWDKRVSMLNPDLIFLTGDIIDHDDGIETAVQTISGLRARYGSFLVLGNHDYYDYRTVDKIKYHLGLGKTAINRNNIECFVASLRKINVHVLMNSNVNLQVDGNPVFIEGTDDPVTQQIDF